MKKMTLAILALVLVTVTTAFTWQRNDAAVKQDPEYAYFQYQLNDPSGENDEENWQAIETSGNCLSQGDVLCIIYAPMGVDGHPDFSGIPDVRNSSLITFRSFKE